jgi:hypothetical protein
MLCCQTMKIKKNLKKKSEKLKLTFQVKENRQDIQDNQPHHQE